MNIATKYSSFFCIATFNMRWFHVAVTFLVISRHMGKTQSKTSKCSDFKSSHTAINDCLLPIGEDVHLQLVDGRRFLSDLNNTKLLCRKGKLQDAMSCLEEIYNDCASDKNVEGNPGFMLNVGKWRRAMQSVCDNIDYLLRHQQCTEKTSTLFNACIKSKSKSFLRSHEEMLKSALRRQNDVIHLGCSFGNDVIACFSKPLENEISCPCRYRRLIVDAVANSLPPICDIDTDFYYYYSTNDCLNEYDDDISDNDDGSSKSDGIDDVGFDTQLEEEGGVSFADPSKVHTDVIDDTDFVDVGDNFYSNYGDRWEGRVSLPHDSGSQSVHDKDHVIIEEESSQNGAYHLTFRSGCKTIPCLLCLSHLLTGSR